MWSRHVIVAALLAGAFAIPARAAGGSVHASFTAYGEPTGDASMTVVECDAVAFFNGFTDYPLATSVHCWVDGAEQSATAPGAFAITAFPTISSVNFRICAWAEAIFLDQTTGRLYEVVDPGVCGTA